MTDRQRAMHIGRSEALKYMTQSMEKREDFGKARFEILNDILVDLKVY